MLVGDVIGCLHTKRELTGDFAQYRGRNITTIIIHLSAPSPSLPPIVELSRIVGALCFRGHFAFLRNAGRQERHQQASGSGQLPPLASARDDHLQRSAPSSCWRRREIGRNAGDSHSAAQRHWRCYPGRCILAQSHLSRHIRWLLDLLATCTLETGIRISSKA
jgi:hypothetical protein